MTDQTPGADAPTPPEQPILVNPSPAPALAIQGLVLVAVFGSGYLTALFATGASVFDFVLLHEGVIAPVASAVALWAWRARAKLKEEFERRVMAVFAPDKVAQVKARKNAGN